MQPGQDILRAVAQFDPEVIDQSQAAIGLDLGVEGQLGVRGAATHQGTARVVANAAEHRGADAGGANHRMRLPAQRRQRLLQPVQGGAGQADGLLALVDQLHSG